MFYRMFIFFTIACYSYLVYDTYVHGTTFELTMVGFIAVMMVSANVLHFVGRSRLEKKREKADLGAKRLDW
jgi:hypothetical protein